jgi:hypothetical protein
MDRRKANIHVVPLPDGQWGVKKERVENPLAVFPTQKEAIEEGKNIARVNRVELLIHGEDGKIRDKISYGNDPFPPVG